jgi:hypothetical protein
MRIVLIHGRAAAMAVPALMARDWEAALRFGLDRAAPPGARASRLPDLDVRFAFYGSIWRPDERQPLPTIEFGPPAPELALPGLGDLSLWVDQHLGLADSLLDLLLHDVDDYYAEPDLRKLTNERLTDAVRSGLPPGERAVVVAFSMGTLVAYDALRGNPTLPVGALVTCGSPLAMPSIYRRVEATGPRRGRVRTPFPSQLRMWVNAWTKDDPATAGHRDMAARYPALDPAAQHVQDLETWGRSATPTSPFGAHDALDYLSSRTVGTAVRAAVRALAP